MIAKDSGGGQDFDPIAAGNHHAICYGLWDLGHQYAEKWDKWTHKIIIGWEIPGERIELEKDGEMKNLPRVISNSYTLSLHEKAWLRIHLRAWRGREFTLQELDGFQLKNILGVNCLINIIHEPSKDGKKTYANVGSISPLMQGMDKKTPENPIQYFSMEEHGTDAVPEETYPWIKKLIEESREWKEIDCPPSNNEWAENNPPPPEEEDSIPF